jgi:hypothetical protein
MRCRLSVERAFLHAHRPLSALSTIPRVPPYQVTARLRARGRDTWRAAQSHGICTVCAVGGQRKAVQGGLCSGDGEFAAVQPINRPKPCLLVRVGSRSKRGSLQAAGAREPVASHLAEQTECIDRAELRVE